MKADYMQEELDLPENFSALPAEALRDMFILERKRSIVLEKDLFKSMTDHRRLDTQFKQLQEQSTVNAKNRNNTSSAFTLPSEFKQAWDELVTELMIDAFSNID